MISGLNGLSYDEKLKELELDRLELRRQKLDLTQVYKIIKGKDNVDRKIWFQTQGESRLRITRQNEYDDNILNQEIPRLDLRANFFSQRMINKWNNLPSEVKDSNTIDAFKSSLNSYMQEIEQQS